MDTLAAIWRRLRDNAPVHHPDKKHLHHKLINLGLNTWGILAVVYSLCLVTGLPLVLEGLGYKSASSISIVVVWILLILFFAYIHFANRFRWATK